MITRSRADQTADRITLRTPATAKRAAQRAARRAHLWTLAGGVTGSVFLLWVMVQLGQASSDAQPKPGKPAGAQAAVKVAPSAPPPAESEANSASSSEPATQGPAIDTPREIIDMLDQRKKDQIGRAHV